MASEEGISVIDLNCHSEENSENNQESNVAIDFELPDDSSTLVSSQSRAGCKNNTKIKESSAVASLEDCIDSTTRDTAITDTTPVLNNNNNKTDIDTKHNSNNLHSSPSMDKSSSDESKRETIEDVHSQQIVTSQTEATATSSLHSKTTPEPTSESPSKHESSDQSKEKGAGGAIPKMTSSKKTAPSTRGRFASQSGGDVHRQQSIHHQRHHRGSTGGLGPGVGSRHPDFPLRIVVNTDMIGAIIGKSGGTIKDITRESNARVDVLRKDNSGAIDKVICIFGSPENCSKACLKIMQVVQQEAIHLTKNPNDFPLRILAHNSLIGRIIGKSGATIKKIMETTDCRITVAANIFDSSNPSLPERVITIIGNSVEAACNAEEQISQKLRSCYENEYALASMIPPVMPGFASQGHIHPGMMHHQVGREGPTRAGQHPQFGAPSLYGHLNAAAALLHNPTAFAAFGPPHAHPGSLSASALGPPLHSGDTTKVSVNVYVPAYAVGGIIGPKGSTIREITQLTGAQVKVPQLKGPQGGDLSAGSSERKVTVVGTQEAQWRAQFHIFKKVLVDSVAPNIPMETTLRVEIMVPSSQVGRIIGKNGQTVRELQRLTHAQIKLPEPSEEGSSTASTSPDAETPVSITGDFYSAWSAQRQIRALVMRGQTPGSGDYPQQLPHVTSYSASRSVKSTSKTSRQKERKKSPSRTESSHGQSEKEETKEPVSEDSNRQESSPSSDPSISSSSSVDLPPPFESSGEQQENKS